MAKLKLFSPAACALALLADKVASVGVPCVMLVFCVPSLPVLVELCEVWRCNCTCVNAIIASGLTAMGRFWASSVLLPAASVRKYS